MFMCVYIYVHIRACDLPGPATTDGLRSGRRSTTRFSCLLVQFMLLCYLIADYLLVCLFQPAFDSFIRSASQTTSRMRSRTLPRRLTRFRPTTA